MGLKTEQFFLGIMSGTSCDGLDLALVGFSELNENVSFRWIAQRMIPYDNALRLRLLDCSKLGAQALAYLENEWTIFVADSVNAFLAEHAEKPICIGFHGHTVFHRPELGYTVQMGSGATLSARCRIDVVCDFRQQDTACGGQGAPLVPVCERDLFSQFDAFLNIGGFANASLRDIESDKWTAFDVCGANIVLNKYAEYLELPYDANGAIARSGEVNTELIAELQNLTSNQRADNRNSLGLEWLELHTIPILERWLVEQQNRDYLQTIALANLLASYTEFIALRCGVLFKSGNVLVSGGGAHNGYLIERLRHNCASNLIIADQRITDFKEALAFAYLAFCRINFRENTLVSVTGANRANIGGAWYKA